MNKIIKCKMIVSVLLITIVLVLFACGMGDTNFIDDGNGHKQYKDDKGNFVKDDWVQINDKYYYFDMNGYLVTNQWIQDEYYVDENGIMQTNFWYDDKNGNMYYLGDDGKYLKDTIKEIDSYNYAFDGTGKMIKNAPYASNGVAYFFGNDGKADTAEGYKAFADSYCYVTNDGTLLLNDWKEDNGKWYYFNEVGLMLKNSFVDGGYYVDENGEMVKNKELKIGGDTYVFNDNGQSTMKARKINKNVDWIVKNPFAKSYYTTTIHNDFNTKLDNKKIKATFNGSEHDVSVYVDAGGIEFKIYLFGDSKVKDIGLSDREATMQTENGERVKIWYHTFGEGELSWGVTLNGDPEKDNTYNKIINLLCKNEDTKYTITFPNSTLSLNSEICPGNFAIKYAPYKDKVLW